MQKIKNQSLLEEKLSYKLIGIFIEISKMHGYLLKEKAYYQLIKDKLSECKLGYIQHPKIILFNSTNGKFLSYYYPDFLVENKIILEVKSQNQIYHDHINQLIKYLSISKYEIGLIVNFGTPKVQVIRRIFTNDRKPYLLK